MTLMKGLSPLKIISISSLGCVESVDYITTDANVLYLIGLPVMMELNFQTLREGG